MEQRTVSEDSGSAPTSKLKIGRKVAPVGQRSQSHSHNKVHLSNLKVINKLRPREEEITKCQTKCFFFLIGVGIMAFGIGLTFYGDDADLRDFLILGPSMLIMGFLLIVIGLVLICKDVYILNSTGHAPYSDCKRDDEQGFYYNINPLNVQEVAQANRRMDVYALTSRPDTVTSLRSDGALTTSELLIEQGSSGNGGASGSSKRWSRETPDPVVPSDRTNSDRPIKSVPHPRPELRTVQNTNNSATTHGGNTITVKSSDEGNGSTDAVRSPLSSTHITSFKTRHGSNSDSVDDGNAAFSGSTSSAQIKSNESQDYSSTKFLQLGISQRTDTEPMTTEL